MSRTSFQNALAEIVALLGDSSGNPVASLATAGCVKVFPYEPGSGWQHPCSITIAPSGIEPTDWTITVRVYVAGKVVADVAQDLLINTTVACSDLLETSGGPDRWVMGWVPELDCWVASCDLMVGREDGF